MSQYDQQVCVVFLCCPPPHEVRKGDYWIRQRLSVCLSVYTNKYILVVLICLEYCHKVLLSRLGTLELHVHWY